MPRFLPLPKSGLKRWLALLGYVLAASILTLILLAVSVYVAFQKSPGFQGWVFAKMMPTDPLPTAASYQGFTPNAATVQSATEIYQPTNIWTIHFHFTEAEYAALGPRRIPMMSMRPADDSSPVLRNTNASRNGLAGVLGFEFPWSTAEVDFGGRRFTNAGVRFKGNGTFLGGVSSYKKPLKLDLHHRSKGQALGGRTVFNLGNLSADSTCLSDTLAYEFFREAGVRAPRTAFARVFQTIDGRSEVQNRLLGLYTLVENPDSEWATDAFGTKGVALFKPVTTAPFTDLGREWTNYHGIYDPKTKTTAEQRRRVIDFCQLVGHAPDAEFNERLAEYLDLGSVARFFAGEVLLANYDGILSQGQNYLVSLDPQSNRFAIIPWDLDHSWGEFPFIGTADERERSSIQRPWVSRNRFLERLWAQPEFAKKYRAELQRLLETLFQPSRLEHRIDELAAVLRPAVAEMPPKRLVRFEHAVSSQNSDDVRDGQGPMDPDRPGWQLKRFIRARSEHVRKQLAGEEEGVVLPRMKF